MEALERGAIHNMERYKQAKLLSYEGMKRRRNITPTDIDGFIDYNGISFIYIEGKCDGADLEGGQIRAFINACDSHEKAGHPSCLILFRHTTTSDEIIIVKDQVVEKAYYKNEWRNPTPAGLTVLEFVQQWEKHWDRLGLNL